MPWKVHQNDVEIGRQPRQQNVEHGRVTERPGHEDERRAPGASPDVVARAAEQGEHRAVDEAERPYRLGRQVALLAWLRPHAARPGR